MYGILVTPKVVKKVIANLDLLKGSGPDCILVVDLKKCELGLSYIPAEPFKICLNRLCFPDCRKVSYVVPVLKNVVERLMAKNYCPVRLLSVVSKVSEKLLNNRLVVLLKKCGFLSDFWYGFRCFWLIDVLTVVSDRIVRVFNMLGATPAVALEISKDFNKVWHAGLLYKFTSYGLSGQVFGLI